MMEEIHQQRVEHMIKSVKGSAGLLHDTTKPTPWRRSAQILEKEEDGANSDCCEEKRMVNTLAV